jgi:hypothetical protein
MASDVPFITPDVHWCIVGDRVVFLDLGRDRYQCLSPAASSAFVRMFPNQANSKTENLKDFSPDVRDLVARLLQTGLLTHEPTAAISERASVQSVSRSLWSETPALGPVVQRSAAFWFACTRASTSLRYRGIRRAVRAIEAKKLRGVSAQRSGTSLHHEISVFKSLRPHYPRKYLCLFDSLALLHFLAQAGFHPDWVFGVSIPPFNAHCWIQHGNTVLNDDVETVQRYTPIMVV